MSTTGLRTTPDHSQPDLTTARHSTAQPTPSDGRLARPQRSKGHLRLAVTGAQPQPQPANGLMLMAPLGLQMAAPPMKGGIGVPHSDVPSAPHRAPGASP